MTEIRTCPICGRIYKDYPALSRRDNTTEICPQCGVKEALDDFYKIFDDKKEDNKSNG